MSFLRFSCLSGTMNESIAKNAAKFHQWLCQMGREMRLFLARCWGWMKGMQIYALVGKSGTGKSFRAKLLAEKLDVSCIVDDGLLIDGNTILAGKSAKQEKNYISAIRTALFSDPDHCQAVTRVIRERKIRRILLLGTSERMVAKMAEMLRLPPIRQIIRIEEIASQQDIEKAIKARFEEGKHVIPVPAIEVKRDYSQILSDNIRIFFKGNKNAEGVKTSRFFEKSVVQPQYHEEKITGTITISEAALTQMILHCIDEQDTEIQAKKIKVRSTRGGYAIDLFIAAPYGKILSGDLHELRAYIIHNIQKYTGIIIEHLEISIDTISPRKVKKARKA